MTEKSEQKWKGEPMRKRTKIDLEMKLKIIKKYEGGQSLTAVGRDLGLAPSTVNTIVKDAARIKEHAKGSASLKSIIIPKTGSGAIYDMEKLLTIWMEDQIQKRVSPSIMTIQMKARSLFEDIKSKYPDGTQSFVASNGWFARFKNRAGLHNVKVSGEAASGDTEAAEKYPERLKKIIDEGPYLPQQVFNVDETGLFWKKMPCRTYIFKEEKTMPGHKASKDRLTLLLGGNASGCCKLKPLLVYHSENPRALRGISKATLPIYYSSNSKAWVTITVFESWFINCFVPEVEKYCRESDIPFKILLIVDNAPGHPSHLNDFHPNIKVLYLLPYTNSLIQPMDQGVIANFKAYYLRKAFAQALAATDRDPDLTVRDFWKSYNIYQAIQNIAQAWEEVTQKCMNSVWKKICPHFVQSKDGKDETFEDLTEKIVKLAEQLKLEADEHDIEELIDSHHDELSNEELIELEAAKVAEDDQTEASELEEEPTRRFVTKEMAIAFREISAGMARLEKMDPNTSRFLKVQREIDDALACYREIYEEKKKVSIPMKKVIS